MQSVPRQFPGQEHERISLCWMGGGWLVLLAGQLD